MAFSAGEYDQRALVRNNLDLLRNDACIRDIMRPRDRRVQIWRLSRTQRFKCLSHGRRPAPAGDKRDYKKNDRNDKKYVSDPRGFTCGSAEPKKFSNDRYDKEN
jgi:hypothetical protein